MSINTTMPLTPPNTPPMPTGFQSLATPLGAATAPFTNRQLVLAQPFVPITIGDKTYTRRFTSFDLASIDFPEELEYCAMALPELTPGMRYEIMLLFPGTVFPMSDDIPGSTRPTVGKIQEMWEKYNVVTKAINERNAAKVAAKLSVAALALSLTSLSINSGDLIEEAYIGDMGGSEFGTDDSMEMDDSDEEMDNEEVERDIDTEFEDAASAAHDTVLELTASFGNIELNDDTVFEDAYPVEDGAFGSSCYNGCLFL